MRKDDLELLPEQSFIPLKPRDLQIAKSMASSEILPVSCQIINKCVVFQEIVDPEEGEDLTLSLFVFL